MMTMKHPVIPAMMDNLSLTTLPNDALIHICSFLDVKSEIRLSQTCKAIHGFANDGIFPNIEWKTKLNQHHKFVKISRKLRALKQKQKFSESLNVVYKKFSLGSFVLDGYPDPIVLSNDSSKQIDNLDRFLKSSDVPKSVTDLSKYENKIVFIESQIKLTNHKMCCRMTLKTAGLVCVTAFVALGLCSLVILIVSIAESNQ